MTLRLTRAQVREIDRRATAEYGIPSIVLMENAARGAADVAMEMLAGIDRPKVHILCGKGNNGGDGLAVARHLHIRGVEVSFSTDPSGEMTGDAAINFRITSAIRKITNLRWGEADVHWFSRMNLVIDSILGTGLSRPIMGRLAEDIEAFNRDSRSPILAIDLPSGLDCDTGLPLGPCIRATRTVTFVAEKAGFANPASRAFTGQITVVDIGVPPELSAAVAAT